MTVVVLALLAQAVVAGLLGPRLLRAGGWADRAPRAGLAVAVVLAIMTVGAVLLAAVVLAAPLVTGPTLARAGDEDLLQACLLAVHEAYAHGDAARGWPALVGLTVTVGLLGRLGLVGLVAGARSGRRRRRHADGLALVAADQGTQAAGRSRGRSRGSGVVVVPHPAPLVYCVPGPRGRVVVSEGAVRALGDDLEAVLAHERAHLRGHHHLLVLVSGALDEAVPGVPVLAAARDAVARLVELVADDAASHRHGRRTVAEALVTVACGPAPDAALGAGGPSTLARVTRLLGGADRPPRHVRALLAVVPLVLALAPVAVAAAPLASTAHDGCATVTAAR